MASSSKTLVIGAGPAGLSCAYTLAKEGVPVEVYEASPFLGGLSRSFELWGQTVDLGPHRFFSSDRIVNQHWNEVVGEDHTWVHRLTRIHYNDRFFYYPLQPFNAFTNLGVIDVTKSVLSYLRSRLFPIANPTTFEEWVTNRFGKHLFSIFFKTYSEKVWGIPCSKIDADWAAQRIKKLSLYEAIKAALFKDRKQKHKTLVDQFAYPRGGTGTIYTKMAQKIEQWGGKVHLNSPVSQILRDERGHAVGIRLQNGEIRSADYVVSTMPLTSMVKGLKDTPADVARACDQLSYRNTILVYLEVEGSELFPDNWVYIHSPEVQHGRVTNFRNWCPSLYGDAKNSILCMEFWCFENDPIWRESDDSLGRRAEAEIRKISLVDQNRKIFRTHVVRVPKSYPVYETGYMNHLKIIQSFVDSIPHLLAIGRYGAFKYNNQDHSILMGLLAAKEILTGEHQGLWEINTDSEYQEKAEISEILSSTPKPSSNSVQMSHPVN